MRYVVHVSHVAKQNLTVQLEQETIRRAKILAAQRGTSVSQLVARTIDQLVQDEAKYEAARKQAMALLEKGFRLGGRGAATRDELHER